MKKVNLIEAGLEVGDTVYFLDGTTKVVTEIESIHSDYPISLEGGEDYTEYGELLDNGTSGVNIFLAPVTLEIPTKKPEPDWLKVFTLDKPFMVRDWNDGDWCFSYAMCYVPRSSHPFKTFCEGLTQLRATHTNCFRQVRKLTLEELEERNLPKDIYETSTVGGR